ncbi:MAG TPA: prolyl oligopeptidase family serine peptidase [Actinomycetes bacterium]|nr:prolyl oligopeptidase family serine peptidase [Actinomycetes bacterium]
MSDAQSFPRQSARTQRFTLGTPRSYTIAPDRSRVVFLRSKGGTDRVHCLWVLDLPAGRDPQERLAADPAALLHGGTEHLSAAERARRERARQSGAGLVDYSTDKAVTQAAYALSSRLFRTDLRSGESAELPAQGPVLDPRLDPTGARIAYVNDGTLRLIEIDGSGDRALAEPDGPDVTWGLAEFVAGEEMGRDRGYWWSPDGEQLLAARVDNTPVQRWYIADPEHPERPPAAPAYPAAGTANAAVTAALIGIDGARIEIRWDTDAFPYLAAAHWSAGGPPLLLVQSRDQRQAQVLSIDPGSGLTRVERTDADPSWLDLIPGVPCWTPDGRLVLHEIAGDETRLMVGGTPVTEGLQVRAVASVDEDGALIRASAEDPTRVDVYLAPLPSVGAGGNSSGAGKPAAIRLSEEPGVHAAVRAAGLTVLTSMSMDRFGPSTRLLDTDGSELAEIASLAETPVLTPSVRLHVIGERALRTAVLLPTGWAPGSGKLPVLLDPYGGPQAQRVLSARNAYLEPQWLADQGFAVVIVDGRGTAGRGPAWDRAVFRNFADPVLEDQVDALQALAADYPDFDLERVAIRGWSFGGYLSALAVLRRPDVFRAAVAGAPVTEWRLYDTHYTERYLGHPDTDGPAYDHSSLVADASRLDRPLMIIHGLADDNVVAAHSLRLSSALLAAGKPHTMLPLSGVTHMTPQEVVAENLMLLQVEFLHSALG